MFRLNPPHLIWTQSGFVVYELQETLQAKARKRAMRDAFRIHVVESDATSPQGILLHACQLNIVEDTKKCTTQETIHSVGSCQG